MAAITTTTIGLLGAGYQIYKGAQDKKDAEAAAERYERQEFYNVADQTQVSTAGSKLASENAARLSATQVSALGNAGLKGVIGGLGYVDNSSKDTNAQISAELDAKYEAKSNVRAQDAANIRTMQENRENQDLAALSSQYNAANQMMWQGIGGVAQTGMAGLGALDKANEATKAADKFKNMKKTFDPSVYTPKSIYFQR